MFFRKWKSFVIKVIWLVVIVGHRRQWVQELVLRGRGSGGLSGVLVEKQGLSLKQWGKIYQCCVRSVLLYSFNPLLVFGENIGCRCSNECNSSYYWLSTWLITWKYNAVNKSWLVAAFLVLRLLNTCWVEKVINRIVLIWTIKFNFKQLQQWSLKFCINWKVVGFLEFHIFPG